MTCDCLSCGLSHPHNAQRGNRKRNFNSLCLNRADERGGDAGGKERESSFVSESRDVCGREFLTDTRSLRLNLLLCGCGRTGRLCLAGTMSHLSSVTLCLIGCLLTGNAVLRSLCFSVFSALWDSRGLWFVCMCCILVALIIKMKQSK